MNDLNRRPPQLPQDDEVSRSRWCQLILSTYIPNGHIHPPKSSYRRRTWKSECDNSARSSNHKYQNSRWRVSPNSIVCQVALRLARLLTAANHTVTSIIRDPAHESDITDLGAKPALVSLEDAPASDFTKLFTGLDVVYFSAGAGGKGGEERTKKVDYEGAVKIFDAIEAVEGEKPRLILVSAIDVRDPDKIPAHYVSIHLIF